jgi:putative heme-binding domain-containing protein
LPIVDKLLRRDEDADDPFLPLLLWWAIEAQAETGQESVLAMFRDPALWDEPLVRQHILERLMRRYAQAGGRKNLLVCAELFELAPQPAQAAVLMKGFEVAFSGRTVAAIPEELSAALAKAGGGSIDLRLRRGDDTAVTEVLERIQDEQQPQAERVRFIQVLGQINRPQCVPVLLRLAATSKSDEVRGAALGALQAYDEPRIGTEVVRLHNDLPDEAKPVAQSLLASRRDWTNQLLAAVQSGAVPADAISKDVVQRMLFHGDASIADAVKSVWGDVQATDSEALRAEVARLEKVIAAAAGNPYQGRQLFREHCGKCHTLYTEGGEIGPNLTSYKRDDLQRMLLNIVHPSLEIREGFENFIVFTIDGRSLNGFVAEQDNRVVVLKGADGQTLILSRDDIDDMQAIPRSLMPERVLQPLDDQQVRDLFAYLRSTQPLP